VQPAYSLGKLTRKRSDGSRYWSFCIKYPDPSSRTGYSRVSLGTTCPVAAETAAKRYWEARTLSRADTIGAMVAAYLDSLGGAKDEYNKRCRWRKMDPYWASLTCNDIDEDATDRYLEWRKGVSVNSIRNEIGLLRAALRWAWGKKVIPSMPLLKWPQQPRSTTAHLSKVQFRKYLDCCVMPHVKLFAILAVTTGARKGALLEAKWDQIDWDRRLFDLGEGNAIKGRAIVPLNDRAMDALREAKEGAISAYIIEVGGDRINDIKKGIGAAGKRLGLHVHPHMFRHSAAVWMAEDRVTMSDRAAFLGHSSTRITEKVYARYHPDYLRNASRSLDW
jgi:integrase